MFLKSGKCFKYALNIKYYTTCIFIYVLNPFVSTVYSKMVRENNCSVVRKTNVPVGTYQVSFVC